MMLLAELQHESLGGRLYIESLANVLAVHLLRRYATAKPDLPKYEGGLPQRQLLQVLEHINEYLTQDIKLADLAGLLDMSQFYFSHLFKQSLGISPYQYLIQQRIERTKQLLKHNDRSIMDIAFLCGFNSHFSIPTGGSAYFNNAANIQNIFSRVTGASPSNNAQTLLCRTEIAALICASLCA